MKVRSLKYVLVFIVFCFHAVFSTCSETPSAGMQKSEKIEPILLVHGGAGWISDEKIPAKMEGVRKSVEEGYKILKEGGSALDAVEASVRIMEDLDGFNAGYGSVLNIDGEVEMDASIMLGRDLSAGGVTVVKDISHPISLARLVMERTPHILLAGPGANRFAMEQGIPILPPGSLVTNNSRMALKFVKSQQNSTRSTNNPNVTNSGEGEVGTVGAVAIDCSGSLAAATSTGGLNGKMVGRSSDSSIIGSGTYADDLLGAVSTTGHGESIAKVNLAHSIIKEIENGKSAQDATKESLEKMTKRLNNTAGAITISSKGDLGIYFTSKRMAWAYQQGDKMHFGVNHDEDNVVNV